MGLPGRRNSTGLMSPENDCQTGHAQLAESQDRALLVRPQRPMGIPSLLRRDECRGDSPRVLGGLMEALIATCCLAAALLIHKFITRPLLRLGGWL